MQSTSQIYLEFELEKGDITGESPIVGYEKRIDIDTFSFEAGTKLKTFRDVEIRAENLKPRERMNNLEISRVSLTKPYDSSSPQLARMLQGRDAAGTEREGVRFVSATISVDQQYIALQDYEDIHKYANQILILKLCDGYVSNISLRTSEAGTGAQIIETVELSFHKFEVIYWYEDRDSKGNLISTWRPKAIPYATERNVHGN
jgi:type VI protein secretion system component Hcp